MADELVGQIVEGRYHVEAPLGRGSMGMVYRARHVRVGCEVAIKVLHEHLVHDPTMVRRFEREVAIAGRLAHRNLVGVLDVAETAQHQKVMVLELARGDSLATLVDTAPLPAARIAHLALELLRGLEHAHAAGLVHRDMKPENVIVDRDDGGVEVPRIVDFGIAALRDDVDGRLTAVGMVLGTPAYMAPEQAYGGDPDPRSDLFALGVIVYEMLCGQQPFEGTAMEVVLANAQQDPPPIAQRVPGLTVDPMLEAFARKLMARSLPDRFASARDAIAMLELIEHDRERAAIALGIARTRRAARDHSARATGPTAPMDSLDPVESPALPRRRLPFALAGLVALAVGGATGFRCVEVADFGGVAEAVVHALAD